MVVEQEMAEIYVPDAEGLAELLPQTNCGKCGFRSCIELAEDLIARRSKSILLPGYGQRMCRYSHQYSKNQ